MDYFIADTHFGDENIRQYENRPFASVDEMDAQLIHNWCSVVKPEDTIFVVGDFFSKVDAEYINTILRQLTGKITLIRGNHDTDEIIDLILQFGCGNVTVIDYPIIYKNFWLISHEPLYINTNMPYANIFGHVHANPNYKDVSSRGFCACVERIWYKPIAFAAIYKAVLAQEK